MIKSNYCRREKITLVKNKFDKVKKMQLEQDNTLSKAVLSNNCELTSGFSVTHNLRPWQDVTNYSEQRQVAALSSSVVAAKNTT